VGEIRMILASRTVENLPPLAGAFQVYFQSVTRGFSYGENKMLPLKAPSTSHREWSPLLSDELYLIPKGNNALFKKKSP